MTNAYAIQNDGRFRADGIRPLVVKFVGSTAAIPNAYHPCLRKHVLKIDLSEA